MRKEYIKLEITIWGDDWEDYKFEVFETEEEVTEFINTYEKDHKGDKGEYFTTINEIEYLRVYCTKEDLADVMSFNEFRDFFTDGIEEWKDINVYKGYHWARVKQDTDYSYKEGWWIIIKMGSFVNNASVGQFGFNEDIPLDCIEEINLEEIPSPNTYQDEVGPCSG